MKKIILFFLHLFLLTNIFTQTTYTVNAGSYYYNPTNLTIEVGDSVVWINDYGYHDVNGDINSITNEPFSNPETFDSPATSTAGAVIFSYKFTVEGTYNYDCSVGSHAANGMVGSVIVNPGSSSGGPYTLIPDQNFEQALIDLGHDDLIDGQVLTANINSVDSLDVSGDNVDNPGFIFDLTGIEDFSSLTYLNCRHNQLTSLEVSQNTALTHLDCEYNQLTSLDVSQNTGLIGLECGDNQLTSLDVTQNTSLNELECEYNQLTSLDVSQNTSLNELDCDVNQLTSLDVSQNTALTELNCSDNELTCLNIKNGNNTNIQYLYTTDNPNLTCIEVDDADYSNANWLNDTDFQLDDNHYFSNDCDYPDGCGGFTNCDDIVVSDTTEFYVSSIEFESISPEYYLISVDTLVSINNPDCDSIVNRFNKYTYSNCGYTDTLYIDITITGISNITNTISIYPNPANEFVIIDNGNYSSMTNYKLKIVNALGQEVFNSLINIPLFEIAVSTLGAEGTYFVQLLDGDGNLVVTKYLILN